MGSLGFNDIFYQSENYHLSYLSNGHPIGYLDANLGAPAENVGRGETAICFLNPWKCLILYDDHRENMLKIAHDPEALIQYWKDCPDKGFTSDGVKDL